jgi:site-specific recombinase XerD
MSFVWGLRRYSPRFSRRSILANFRRSKSGIESRTTERYSSVASLDHDDKSGRFRIRFRYGGRDFKRSMRTMNRREAEAIRGRVEETIMLIERGRLDIPSDADPGTFILSDGRRINKPSSPKVRTLADFFRTYSEELPPGAKEESTLVGEQIHVKHLLRHLKPSRVVQSISVGDLQRYVDLRSSETWNGKSTSSETIKKEITTFRLIWHWALNRKYVDGPPPTKGIAYAKRDERPSFMTWQEIEQTISRGGMPVEEEEALWDCLFLTREEIDEVLAHVSQAARHPFVYPMFVFVAHTGARRSEILRSQIDDFDFQSGTVRIRERKKSREKRTTYRRVPLTGLLAEVMSSWFSIHPGGRYTLCHEMLVRGRRRPNFPPVTCHSASAHFYKSLADSKWARIKGFHVFRHSFASNLAAAGVDQRLIDEWLGHQTEEMRRRYRHLFPTQERSAIDSVFGRNGQ